MGSRFVVVLCFAPLALGLAGCSKRDAAGSGGGSKRKRGPSGPALVEVAVVKSGELNDRWSFLGDVRSMASSQLAAGAEGAVQQVLVRAGDHVKRGQLLLSVDSALAIARVRVAEAAVKQTAEDLAQAKREVARFKRLGRRSVAEIELERARSKVTNLAAKLAGQRASVAEARALLARHRVRAPYDAVVSKRLVDPGTWVSAGTKVLDVVATSDVEVLVNGSSQLLGYIKAGDRAVLARAGTKGAAEVVGVVPALDPVARTALIRLKPAANLKLLAGASVSVSFEVKRKGDGVVVPRDALVVGAVGTRVIKIVGGDGAAKAVSVSVDVVAAAGEQVLVVSRAPQRSAVGVGTKSRTPAALAGKLVVGDRVVTRGNERLRPGQSVRFSRSARASSTR
ncbi:MAG: efflux RND transporter periplasmic adaptor subunit [Myxococcales bacterium]|nr:efflux RND transporter periplasmic adaptor subunit [Myxococcales bacterium]